VTKAAAILFNLGGVLLPFDQERRVTAVCTRLGVAPDAVRQLFAGDLPRRMDLGQADEDDYAAAFFELARRPVSPEAARELILSVFEAPNEALWRLVGDLRTKTVVGGFSDNPAFVAARFPPGAVLDPMIFSAEIGVAKPSDAAFAAAEARLGCPGGAILFIDDSAANIAAALQRGWDAIQFLTNQQLAAELADRGLP
jgi:putative hydrolase of the HAD superfamily